MKYQVAIYRGRTNVGTFVFKWYISAVIWVYKNRNNPHYDRLKFRVDTE